MGSDDQRSVRLRVIVTDERGRPVRSAGLGPWLAATAPRRTRGIVGVALVSDAGVRALNRRYLGRDYATDVLSFSASGDPKRGRTPSTGRPAKMGYPPFSSSYLGDIVIARGVARRQARTAGHGESQELRLLALHGLLHLLGYDHERDNGRMAQLERRLRKRGGLPAGIIEREGARAEAVTRQP
jgi:probable rRNA maturation factor